MLDRAYAQVDRKKLKQKLIARSVTQGVEFGIAAVDSCDHSDPNHSVVTLSDGRKVYCEDGFGRHWALSQAGGL